MSDRARQTAGTVVEVLPNTTFRVALADGREVVAFVSGRMRRNYAQIARGDRVALELSPDDPGRGKIVQKFR